MGRFWVAGIGSLLLSTVLGGAHAAVPLGLPAPTTQDDPATVALGERLFNDPRLSRDGTIRCATCHVPERGFSDGRPTAHGRQDRVLTRRTPSLLNVAFAQNLFWDGRATDLAAQARSPLLADAEHGLPHESALVEIVTRDPQYVAVFAAQFRVTKASLSIREIGASLAAYERSLLAGNSPFDRYWYGRDPKAMSRAAVRGLALFRGRARCSTCHTLGADSALFTDGAFHPSPLPIPAAVLQHLDTLAETVRGWNAAADRTALNNGIETDPEVAALGRFNVTLDPKDIGAFKTPTLRNVAQRAPYMHNGSVASLAQAIDLELYARAARPYPLELSQDERADLLALLQALTTSELPAAAKSDARAR